MGKILKLEAGASSGASLKLSVQVAEGGVLEK